MDYGELFGGLNAFNVLRVIYNPDGTVKAFAVDDSPHEAWDDLRFPAQGINPAGQTNAPTVDTITFPGTLLFSVAAPNLIAGVAQMPHAWAVGTSITPHIHWAKSNNQVGNVAWEWCYSVADVGEVFPAYSTWEPCTYPGPDGDTMNLQAIAAWSDLSLVGKHESVMIA